jgi:hypothetical protein
VRLLPSEVSRIRYEDLRAILLDYYREHKFGVKRSSIPFSQDAIDLVADPSTSGTISVIMNFSRFRLIMSLRIAYFIAKTSLPWVGFGYAVIKEACSQSPRLMGIIFFLVSTRSDSAWPD